LVSGDLVLSLHVETGPVEAVSTPSPNAVVPPTLDVPLAVSAKLVSTGGWRVSGSCEPPAFGMPSVDAEKRFVYSRVLHHPCMVRLRYKSLTKDLNEILMIEIAGDGTVKPQYAGGKVVVK
jgi:hypothetical protein